jgi:O-methyltransferase
LLKIRTRIKNGIKRGKNALEKTVWGNPVRIQFLVRTLKTGLVYSDKVLEKKQFHLLSKVGVRFYNSRKQEGAFGELVKDSVVFARTSLTKDELYTLYHSVLATEELPGAIAEAGVYRGGSARIVCEAKRADKKLYLFDTFEGMPFEQIDSEKDTWARNYRRTHTGTSIDEVQSYLARFSNVQLVKGVFPDSIVAHPELSLEEEKFSFVHLDVDLYRSTLDALVFFYPRLVPGGRLVSHNYNLTHGKGGDTPGVKLAFLEYFGGSRPIIEIAETQCMVVKPG